MTTLRQVRTTQDNSNRQVGYFMYHEDKVEVISSYIFPVPVPCQSSCKAAAPSKDLPSNQNLLIIRPIATDLPPRDLFAWWKSPPYPLVKLHKQTNRIRTLSKSICLCRTETNIHWAIDIPIKIDVDKKYFTCVIIESFQVE